MLSTILAYVTAAAMLMGAGSVPAVPETAVKNTVENIVISCGDESVALDHKLVQTEAVGSAEAATAFDIVKDGKGMMPLHFKFTPEELLFSLAEGSAYSVSDEDVQGFLELTDEDIAALNEAVEIIEVLPEMFSEGCHMVFAKELYDSLCAHESAEALESEEIQTEGVALHLENGADYAFMDGIRVDDTRSLGGFMQLMLDLMNLADGTEYASYGEMYDGTETYDSYTMYRMSANGVDFGYKLNIATMGEDDGYLIDMIFQPEYFSCVEQPEDPGSTEEPLSFDCSWDNGRIAEATFSYGYTDTEETVYGTEDEYTDACMDGARLKYYYELKDGFASHEFSIDVLMENHFMEDGEEYYSDSARTHITGTAQERIDENGAVVTGVSANMDYHFSYSDVPPTEISLQAAFDIRSEEIPYADAFAGMDITPILDEDDIPPRLMGDVIMLGSRASLLLYDDQLNAVIEMIENSMEENTPVDNRIEEKYKAKEENVLRDAKNAEDAPEEADDSIGMKYKHQEKKDYYKAVPEAKVPDIHFN